MKRYSRTMWVFMMVMVSSVGVVAGQEGPSMEQVSASIERGVAYLDWIRHPWGEFPVHYMCAESGDSLDPDFDPNVFGTALVLLSLSRLESSPRVDMMRRQAVQFLIDQREDGDVWRYYTRLSPRYELLVPDLDDTAIVSLALSKHKVPLGNQVEIIRSNRRPDGFFDTWLFPSDWIHRDSYDNVEWDEHLSALHPDFVVNLNVLRFLASQGQPCEELTTNLAMLLESGEWDDYMVFYHSPLVVLHAFVRALEQGAPATPGIHDWLRRELHLHRQGDGSFGSALETALAIPVALAVEDEPDRIDESVRSLLVEQSLNGSWPRHVAHGSYRHPRVGFGSEALTTGFAIEALVAYRASTERSAE